MPPGIVGTSFLFCVSARLLEPGSTSETYGPGTLPDRRSLGIASETTQTGIDWGRPAGSALLYARVGPIRPIPASSVACATYRKRHIACKLPHEETSVQRDNFRDAHLPLGRPHGIYRSRGGSRGGWNVPTAAGSMTREAALLPFNSVRANVSTIYRISFACTQGRIETE